MVPDKIPNVDPAGQPQQPRQGPEKAGDSAEFRRMLERLEAIAKQTSGSRADVDKVLEEAYRRNQP